MKTIIFTFLILCTALSAKEPEKASHLITPHELGLKIKKGNIDFSIMNSRQKDTVIIDMFNYEDIYFDIAVYYPSGGEVIVYKNCGNGYLTEYKKIKLKKEVKSIEKDSPSDKDLLFNPNLKAGIKINYKDGSKSKITNYQINKFTDEPEIKVPKWDFLNDARAFVYDLSFIEVWRSERNGSPHRIVIAGDIDNDGKNEIIYTFFPISDSTPVFFPQRIVVFESIGYNQYRIDWDTISYNHAMYTALPNITDFDRNGEKEFFAITYSSLFNDLVAGFFECSGERKYKFYRSDELYFQGPLTDIVLIDSVDFVTTRTAGMWICFSASSIGSQISELAFVSKSVSGGYYFKRKQPQNIRLEGFVYDIDVDDLNSDGKTDILLGDTQFSTNYIGYLDSTGLGWPIMQGYEYKEIIPNAPVSAGWLLLKDFDGDNKKEIITCGIGNGSGSIGIIKNYGHNNFITMWWDSAGIVAGPNLGIDSGYIDNKYSILYPCVRYSGPLDFLNLITFTKNNTYSFYKSSFRVIDSAAFLGPRFIDIDNDDKMNIVGSYFSGGPPNWKTFLVDFEQQGTIGIQNISTSIPETFSLHQNYPNPFNNQTKIIFDIKISGIYDLKVYDINGRLLKVIFDKQFSPGSYEILYS